VTQFWTSVCRTRRGVAQPGSALGLGPRGRRFESSRPDQHVREHLTDGFRAFLPVLFSTTCSCKKGRKFALFCRLYRRSVVYLAGSFSILLKFWRWETTNGDHGNWQETHDPVRCDQSLCRAV